MDEHNLLRCDNASYGIFNWYIPKIRIMWNMVWSADWDGCIKHFALLAIA